MNAKGTGGIAPSRQLKEQMQLDGRIPLITSSGRAEQLKTGRTATKTMRSPGVQNNVTPSLLMPCPPITTMCIMCGEDRC